MSGTDSEDGKPPAYSRFHALAFKLLEMKECPTVRPDGFEGDPYLTKEDFERLGTILRDRVPGLLLPKQWDLGDSSSLLPALEAALAYTPSGGFFPAPPFTLGQLLALLETEGQHVGVVEWYCKIPDNTPQGWHWATTTPPAKTLPGADRLELLCDARNDGSGLTAQAVRKLRVELCRIRKCSPAEADLLTLEEVATTLEAHGPRGAAGQPAATRGRTASNDVVILDDVFIVSVSGAIQRSLLKAVNGKGHVLITDVLKAVYAGKGKDKLAALVKAKNRLNAFLAAKDKSCELKRSGETLILSPL
jgi:hypothetical protein